MSIVVADRIYGWMRRTLDPGAGPLAPAIPLEAGHGPLAPVGAGHGPFAPVDAGPVHLADRRPSARGTSAVRDTSATRYK